VASINISLLFFQLSNWEPGDRAVSEHQRFYPNCRFVRGDRADNVSLATAAAAAVAAAAAAVPGSGAAAASAGQPWQLSGSGAAVASTLSNVSNPAMQQNDDRLLTFIHWPSRIPVRPDQLAKAGFYYVGKKYSSTSKGPKKCDT